MKGWDRMPWSLFWMLSFISTFSLSSFTFFKRLFSSSLSALRVVSSVYLRLLIFLLAIFFFFLIFIYYVAVLDLSCGMWDLPCVMGDLLWHTDSLLAAQGLSSCSTQAELLCGMWDLSSPTRDRTHVLCIARQILNHWTLREVPVLAILIPACASSSPTFLMMYSAYKFNKQGDNIQPWRTAFPIWN